MSTCRFLYILNWVFVFLALVQIVYWGSYQHNAIMALMSLGQGAVNWFCAEKLLRQWL